GRSVRSDHLQIKHLKAPGPLRVAAVVSKSVAKKAVERNKLRRALYRALAGLDTSAISGHAVCFVRSVPKGRLTLLFSQELGPLLSNLRH
ncbi:MAG TPA: ribonuclease P protein component, partial [Candidatus Paceibacterota bacterium]|nr:ribonuclease P protein component [Candidatus Paceibacterota bacterium]